MGADHPIAWEHEFDGGRAWYTAGRAHRRSRTPSRCSSGTCSAGSSTRSRSRRRRTRNPGRRPTVTPVAPTINSLKVSVSGGRVAVNCASRELRELQRRAERSAARTVKLRGARRCRNGNERDASRRTLAGDGGAHRPRDRAQPQRSSRWVRIPSAEPRRGTPRRSGGSGDVDVDPLARERVREREPRGVQELPAEAPGRSRRRPRRRRPAGRSPRGGRGSGASAPSRA